MRPADKASRQGLRDPARRALLMGAILGGGVLVWGIGLSWTMHAQVDEAVGINIGMVSGYVSAVRDGRKANPPSLLDVRGGFHGSEAEAGSFGEITAPQEIGGRAVVTLRASLALCDGVAALGGGELGVLWINGRKVDANTALPCDGDEPGSGIDRSGKHAVARNMILIPLE